MDSNILFHIILFGAFILIDIIIRIASKGEKDLDDVTFEIPAKIVTTRFRKKNGREMFSDPEKFEDDVNYMIDICD